MGIRVQDIVTTFDCEWFITPQETPLRIFAYFWEIEQCPGRLVPPNMHVFSMFQDDVKHCEWRNVAGAQGWECGIAYRNVPPVSRLYLINLAAGLYFEGDLVGKADEHDVFTNKNIDCLGVNYATGGNAMVFWGVAALNLINDMNLPNDGNTFMEFFIAEGNVPVYKFCNVKYSLNQKYKISP